MNLRHGVNRCAAITGMVVAAAVLTTPQVMAAGDPMNAEPASRTAGTAGTTESLGRLGPLTDLVIERIRVSDDVAASKYGTDSPIEDPKREAQVLEQVRQQADRAGVDPDAAAVFFRDQITASKLVQKGLFARWTAHPEEAPTTRPDLDRIRERLDQLTTALLQELKDTEHLRGEPVACTVQLVWAGATGAARERLDRLHRQALDTATESVCRSGEPTAQHV
ncbi:chorismate mutase [Streptomyces kunmingensis]|uniref:chorismate mutase n=1 Tax=Streptomyces kunmingensis TaxID=68225 RepID=A0ABU6C860_9ACTN|nr:chorismate mutase [Streptomyces kunmingensis]MEB3960908.1 chorismate mutase [Streptomyces kunmingensis]